MHADPLLKGSDHLGGVVEPRARPSPSDASSAALHFQIVGDERQFLALKTDWDRLHALRERRSGELSFPWVAAAWETIAKKAGRRLAIVVGRIGERVVLVFPLALQRLGPFRIAHGLCSDLHESSDLLVEPGDGDEVIVAAAWDFAKTQFHLFRFLTVRCDARIWPHIAQERARESQPMRAPFIDCARWPDWEAYQASRSRNFRYDCQRALKRLKKAGDVQFVSVEDEDRIYSTLSWTMDRKIEWLARTGRESAVFASRRGFYQRVCEDAFRRGEVVLIELLVNASLVAAQLCFRYGSCLDLTLIAWDREFYEGGPGRLLMLESVHWAFDHAVRFVDLGPGVVEPKYRLTDTDVEAAYLLYVAPGAAGRFLLRSRHLLRMARAGVGAAKKAVGARLASPSAAASATE